MTIYWKVECSLFGENDTKLESVKVINDIDETKTEGKRLVPYEKLKRHESMKIVVKIMILNRYFIDYGTFLI